MAGEVHVAPAQRDELAAPQAGEGRGQVDRAILWRGRGADEGQYLFGRRCA